MQRLVAKKKARANNSRPAQESGSPSMIELVLTEKYGGRLGIQNGNPSTHHKFGRPGRGKHIPPLAGGGNFLRRTEAEKYGGRAVAAL